VTIANVKIWDDKYGIQQSTLIFSTVRQGDCCSILLQQWTRQPE